MKAKRGRPPRECEVSGKSSGTDPHTISVTKAEWKKLNQHAKKAGLSVSVYVARGCP